MPLTFAYGSNMNFVQMRDRCPSAQFICNAVLKNHRLAFTRKSTGRQCGVSDVVPMPDLVVWGVVYEITEYDLAVLDVKEGYRPHRSAEENSYNRRTGTVYQDGDETKPLNVEIYFGVPQENPPLPNQTYKDLIVNGAKHWELPPDYIAELEKIQVAL
jgi:gamma-glutamylcyclotransferase